MEKQSDIYATENLVKQKLLLEINSMKRDSLTKAQQGKKWSFLSQPAVLVSIVGFLAIVVTQIALYKNQSAQFSQQKTVQEEQFSRQIKLQQVQFELNQKLDKKKLEYTVIQKASEIPSLYGVAENLDYYIGLGVIDKEKGYYSKLLKEGRLNEIPFTHRDGRFVFNVDSLDLPTVTVINSTTTKCKAGPDDGCWLTRAYAEKGDTVSVQIYYHNMSNETAKGVGVGLDKSVSGPRIVHEFTGGVAADGKIVATGSAKVITRTPQTLRVIPGSIYVFPNQSTKGRRVLGERYLFSPTGLDMGDVSPDWGGQGTLVVDFKVGD